MMLFLMSLLGCSNSDVMDLSVPTTLGTFASDDYILFSSPIIEVPPYTEVNLCYFGTYTGPDLGVFDYQENSSSVTHHLSLMGVYDYVYRDGSVVDCLMQGTEEVPVYSPLFEAVGFDSPGGEPSQSDDDSTETSKMPDKTAFPLFNGQRWALDLHYINTYDKPVHVNTNFFAFTKPYEEIDNWLGTLQFDSAPFELPVGQSEVAFDCPFLEDITVVSTQGHMHEFGTYFRVDWNKSDGTVETVYEVDAWNPGFKDYPHIRSYDPGTFEVKEGDTLTTYCGFDNPYDEPLPYPAEMCTTLVIGYDILHPVTCVNGDYFDY